MTRVNCVPVEGLVRQHLVAEYRELVRIFPQAKAAYLRGECPNDKRNPTTYKLSTGHVRFFYNKLGWLRERHNQLCNEMRKRGYTTNMDCKDSGTDLPKGWQNDWVPSEEEMKINQDRIDIRVEGMRLKGLL